MYIISILLAYIIWGPSLDIPLNTILLPLKALNSISISGSLLGIFLSSRTFVPLMQHWYLQDILCRNHIWMCNFLMSWSIMENSTCMSGCTHQLPQRWSPKMLLWEYLSLPPTLHWWSCAWLHHWPKMWFISLVWLPWS